MSNLLYGIKDNKSFKEVYSKEELNNSNSLIDKGKLDSTININLLSDAGIYICNNPTTANGYPITLSGTLEVIKTAGSDHIMQRYLVDGSNITYERHVGEELGGWVKIINSGDFAVLTGTITTPAKNAESLTGSVEVNYPIGFTRDNCVVISLMLHNQKKNYKDYWSISSLANDSMIMLYGNNGSATLKPNKIRVYTNKLSSALESETFNYKLVLMKIN